MIYFNKPIMPSLKKLSFDKLSGDGKYTYMVKDFFLNKMPNSELLLTTSCTSALEMTALLINLRENDEIIAPSFTFVSTVNPFVLRGAKIVFVDINPKTMNIDESLIESAITIRTKAIVVVHYAGVSCNMLKILDLAKKYKLYVVEDAAQGVMAKYNGKYLGTMGDFGTYSFHESKNFSMGEGGAIIINNKKFKMRAEIIREKGTNRSSFLRGQVDKYTWMDIGGSHLPSDILAGYLHTQLEVFDEILKNRVNNWNLYFKELSSITDRIELPFIPDYAEHNAHMFYIKARDLVERTELIDYLLESKIIAVFHYVPLHSSPAGLKYGIFHGKDNFTTKESERLLRLPLYYNIRPKDVIYICNQIKNFYSK